jgi:hypothetical protein
MGFLWNYQHFERKQFVKDKNPFLIICRRQQGL